MRFLKSQIVFRLANSYFIDSPQPSNLSYLWNFGSLLGLCLVTQILTGIFLAMHYSPNVEMAFNSLEHPFRSNYALFSSSKSHGADEDNQLESNSSSISAGSSPSSSNSPKPGGGNLWLEITNAIRVFRIRSNAYPNTTSLGSAAETSAVNDPRLLNEYKLLAEASLTTKLSEAEENRMLILGSLLMPGLYNKPYNELSGLQKEIFNHLDKSSVNSSSLDDNGSQDEE